MPTIKRCECGNLYTGPEEICYNCCKVEDKKEYGKE